MQVYTFEKSNFSEPVMKGTNSGIGQPFLTFTHEFSRKDGQESIIIHVDLIVEGVGSDFKLNVKSKSTFRVFDRQDVVLTDVYDMYSKAIEDLRSFLDKQLQAKGQSIVVVPMPTLDQVDDDILTFVGRLHKSN